MTIKKNISICCILLIACVLVSGGVRNNVYNATISPEKYSDTSAETYNNTSVPASASDDHYLTTTATANDVEPTIALSASTSAAQHTLSASSTNKSTNNSKAMASVPNTNKTKMSMLAETTTATATTVSATLAPSLSKYNLTCFDNSLIEMVNIERKKAGLGTLSISYEICDIAAIRAEEASVLWSHTRPSGGLCDTLFDEYKVEWTLVGENLAHASSYNAEKIVKAWMNSESHRANILNASFTTCGIATYTSDSGDVYIAQIFSK